MYRTQRWFIGLENFLIKLFHIVDGRSQGQGYIPDSYVSKRRVVVGVKHVVCLTNGLHTVRKARKRLRSECFF